MWCRMSISMRTSLNSTKFDRHHFASKFVEAGQWVRCPYVAVPSATKKSAAFSCFLVSPIRCPTGPLRGGPKSPHANLTGRPLKLTQPVVSAELRTMLSPGEVLTMTASTLKPQTQGSHGWQKAFMIIACLATTREHLGTSAGLHFRYCRSSIAWRLAAPVPPKRRLRKTSGFSSGFNQFNLPFSYEAHAFFITPPFRVPRVGPHLD